jgi:hypothetical protein
MTLARFGTIFCYNYPIGVMHASQVSLASLMHASPISSTPTKPQNYREHFQYFFLMKFFLDMSIKTKRNRTKKSRGTAPQGYFLPFDDFFLHVLYGIFDYFQTWNRA